MYRFFTIAAAFAGGLALNAAAWAADITISLEDAHRTDLEAAYGHLNAGRPGEAVGIFARVIEAYQNAYDGREARCAQDMKDGAAVTAMALLPDPDELARVVKTLKPGDRALVESEFEKMIVLGPGWCEAIFGKAFALIDLHRSDEAEPLLARVVVMAPTRAHYLNEYAELFKTRREWQRSYDLFAKALDVAKTGPDSSRSEVKARSLRGMGYNTIELGDLDEAERLFRRSLELQPNHAGALSELDYIAQKRKGGS